MKLPIAYYLILLYSTVMFKPLIPLIGDAWSHSFAQAVHISTIHARYGNNHLENELSNTTTENPDNKHQSNINLEDQVSAHIIATELIGDFFFSRTGISFHSLKLYALKTGFIVKNFLPPKFFMSNF